MKKPLLILDLDETLIHTEILEPDTPWDFYFEIFEDMGGWSKKKLYQYWTYKRPHLQYFLDYAFDNFEVAVFTAADEDYATEILSNIGIDIDKLSFFYTSKDCSSKYNTRTMDRYIIKRLKKIVPLGYDLDRVLIVDDKPETADENYGNLISITPFHFNKNDDELLKLVSYLDTIKDEPNLRKIEKRGWRN